MTSSLDHLQRLSDVLLKLPYDLIDRIAVELEQSERVFVAGNGGSSAIASHFVVDLMKICDTPAICLTDNAPMLTALANDMTYSGVFYQQMVVHRITPDDAVILISSSGNSGNVIEAASYAKRRGSSLITLTGFSPVNSLAAINTPGLSLHVNAMDYGIVEDAHHAVMHAIVKQLKHIKDLP